MMMMMMIPSQQVFFIFTRVCVCIFLPDCTVQRNDCTVAYILLLQKLLFVDKGENLLFLLKGLLDVGAVKGGLEIGNNRVESKIGKRIQTKCENENR